jgi:hypothetical protein
MGTVAKHGSSKKMSVYGEWVAKHGALAARLKRRYKIYFIDSVLPS